jgi:hypothetical protein
MLATYTSGEAIRLQDHAAPPNNRPLALDKLLRNSQATKVLFCLAIALIIAISFWMGVGRRYLSGANPQEDIVNLQRTEVDYHQLYPALESKHTFGETFNWWREPWRADEWVGAYWRPLSMQVWWIESHVFGEDRSFQWMRVSLFLAALFDVLLCVFLWRLSRRRLFAIIGLAIFALPGAWLHMISPLSKEPRISNADLLLLQGWKDQPDLFANCLIIGAMIFALRRRYGWALVCAALAPCFKESGLMVFPLLLGVVIYCGDLKQLPKWVYAGVASVLALYMLGRYSAGPMVFHFHTHGGDAGALTRYSNAMFPHAWMSLDSLGEALAGIGISGLLLWRPKQPMIWLGYLIGLIAICVIAVALQARISLDVAFAQFFLVGPWPIAMLVLWFIVTAVVCKQRSYLRPAVFLAVCAFLVAIPFAMVTGALEHVLCLARAFQAGYGACVTLSVGTVLANKSWKP